MLEEIIKEYVAELEKKKVMLLQKNQEQAGTINEIRGTSSLFSTGMIHSFVNGIKKVNDKSNDDVENLKNSQIDKIIKIDEVIEKMKNMDYVVSLLHKERPELFKNPTFMIELVKKDIKYIIYDMTDDDNVYKAFASKVIESSDNEHQNELFSKLIDELDSPKIPETGKYKIPHRFLFEAIRKTFLRSRKENLSYNSYLLQLVDLYFKRDCRYSFEYGKKMEELYDNPNINLLFAGILDHITDIIFEEGYQINYGDLAGNFWNAHDIDNSFLNFFQEFWFIQPRHTMVLATIPKSDTNYIGGRAPSGQEYLFPKYIVGCGRFENGDFRYISNPLQENQRKQYKKVGWPNAWNRYTYPDEVIGEIDKSLTLDTNKNDFKPGDNIILIHDDALWVNKKNKNININEELKTGKRR